MTDHEVKARELRGECKEHRLIGCVTCIAAALKDAEREALKKASKHFPYIRDFGNVTGCEECDWKPAKSLQSRSQFIEHIRALAKETADGK